MVWSYSLRRFFHMIVFLLVLSCVCFMLLGLMPGDPVELMIQSNPYVTSEDVARLKAIYGLDQPLPVRYLRWLGQILQGDLGYSRTYRVPVWDLLGPRLLNTLILQVTSFLVSLTIGVTLGILAALKPRSWWDFLIGLFSFGGISLPSFWFGIMLILVFSVQLGWLPSSGTGSDEGFLGRIPYLVLPTLTLSYLSVGRYIRYTKAAMLEVLNQDFVRTALAKGLPNRIVILKHVLRNALIPIVTLASLNLGSIFSGATITETVFAYQGVGKLIYDSILGNDFNLAMMGFLISITMVFVMNWVADVVYALVDPRLEISQ